MIRRRLETTGAEASSAPRAPLALLCMGLVAAATFMGSGGCYGRSDGELGRFLGACAEGCGTELECIAGVCTRSCESASDCPEQEPLAQCLDAPQQLASGTCDVACVDDAGCQALGASFTCRAGACRQTVRDPIPRVGEPCIPSDEADASFAGFSVGEVNIEAGGSCGASNVCLVNHFQGRVTCPEGDPADAESRCSTPTGQALNVPVPPQLSRRTPEQAVICSCRCDGPDPRADYCPCPDGMRCEELIPSSGFLNAASDFVGSYCVY